LPAGALSGPTLAPRRRSLKCHPNARSRIVPPARGLNVKLYWLLGLGLLLILAIGALPSEADSPARKVFFPVIKKDAPATPTPTVTPSPTPVAVHYQY